MSNLINFSDLMCGVMRIGKLKLSSEGQCILVVKIQPFLFRRLSIRVNRGLRGRNMPVLLIFKCIFVLIHYLWMNKNILDNRIESLCIVAEMICFVNFVS